MLLHRTTVNFLHVASALQEDMSVLIDLQKELDQPIIAENRVLKRRGSLQTIECKSGKTCLRYAFLVRTHTHARVRTCLLFACDVTSCPLAVQRPLHHRSACQPSTIRSGRLPERRVIPSEGHAGGRGHRAVNHRFILT